VVENVIPAKQVIIAAVKIAGFVMPNMLWMKDLNY